MKKFNFLKKTILYYFGLIFSMCLLIVNFCLEIGLISSYITSKNAVVIVAIVLGGFCFLFLAIFPFLLFKSYNRSYTIDNKKLEFVGNVDSYTSVYCEKSIKQTHSIMIQEIAYCFITKFAGLYGSRPIIEKEKINNKKQIMGYMYLMNKFVYDEERCKDTHLFELYNKNEDWKSENYETVCTMCYQKKALNELYVNGFNGEIYLSSAIYQPRKEEFDIVFKKYSVLVDKIHIF